MKKFTPNEITRKIELSKKFEKKPDHTTIFQQQWQWENEPLGDNYGEQKQNIHQVGGFSLINIYSLFY